MSGGCFDYKDRALKDEIFGWSGKFVNALEDREISEIVWDVFDLLYAYDYYASGDTGKDRWDEARKAFKEKWLLPERNEIVKRIVDSALDDARKELYDTFEVNENGELLD